MKATELKLGDWVLYKGKPAKVHSIDPPSIYVEVDDEVWGALEDDGDLAPIPLTEDVLEKNGWKKTKTDRFDGSFWDYRFKHKDRQNLFMKDGVVYNSFYTMDKIPYVHQLQHLLWALGMDDEMKL